ncbi:MAG: TMEM43 family protein [Candidatus Cyclobacteriaceae bacterium M3_2C_046]
MDQFSEVTTESWGSRLMGSIKGILMGIVFILLAIGLLWWNEGRAVKTAKGLKEGAAALVEIQANQVITENEGKLVYLTGKAETENILKDEEFGVAVNALKLQRKVEMYQWVEETEEKKDKQVGGSETTTTTYNYIKEWSSSPVSSKNFRIQEGHQNPAGFPYENYEELAPEVTLEAFNLTNSIVSDINGYQRFTNFEESPQQEYLTGEMYYIGTGTSANPEIGDVKISFMYVPAQQISLIAAQQGATFIPYSTSTGTSIELVENGQISSASMFAAAHSKNNLWTWILRIIGFGLMTAGFVSIFRPLSVIADLVPIIGNIIEMGTGLISGVISFALSFITIATAWIYYRPVLGSILLVTGLSVLVLFYLKAQKKKTIPDEAEMATA